MKIEYRRANLADIDAILALHHRYQVYSINEDDKNDGFITTAFSEQQLSELINKEKGLFVAIKNNGVVAYAMAASWDFWSQWPMFAHMIKGLSEQRYKGLTLSTANSYQYGPVCVDKPVRGEGIFEALFEYALSEMAKRYAVLVTFINKVNPRSFAAHTRKVNLDVTKEFEYNNNHYYELACLTPREKKS